MLTKDNFSNALKRIKPVQRPSAWINDFEAQVKTILDKPYHPNFIPGLVGNRQLSIPPVNDRIVQGAIQLNLYPIWEAQQPATLKAVKGTQKSLAAVKAYIQENPSGVFFKSDIKGFFSSLNQAKTLEALKTVFEYTGWIEAAVRTVVMSGEKGIPQGSPLSPLLADATLLELDKQMAGKDNIFYLRYVDDILLLANNPEDLNQAKMDLIKYLTTFDLSLSPNKTNSGEYPKHGFDLLGEKFFSSTTINTLLKVVGGSAALDYPAYPGEVEIHKSVITNGVSRSESPQKIAYSLDHFLKTLLDRPHPDCLEILASKKVCEQTEWGKKAQKGRDKFLHKGMAKTLHDFAFKTYVGQIKPLKEANKPIPLKEASAVLRSLIIGNSILEHGKFPDDFLSHEKDYTHSLIQLGNNDYEPFHAMVSSLFKANYKLRQNNNLPTVMPYFTEVTDGEDFLDIS